LSPDLSIVQPKERDMNPTLIRIGRRAALALALGAAFAPRTRRASAKYGPGASATEIKLGQTMPYSGPASPTGRSARSSRPTSR
jgi:hypothetical protein